MLYEGVSKLVIGSGERYLLQFDTETIEAVSTDLEQELIGHVSKGRALLWVRRRVVDVVQHRGVDSEVEDH